VSDITSTGGAGSGAGQPIAQSAQEKAGQGATVVTQQASEVTGTVKEQAATVTHEAGTQARQLAAGLREQLSGETRAQGERLVQNLRSLADELHQMGEHGQGDSVATTVVRRLAEGGHQVADHLEQRGPGGMLDEVQDFARRRPGLFLAGAALAGFTLGRTGKDVAAGSGGNGNENGAGDGPGGPSTATGRPSAAEDHIAPIAPLSDADALGETTTTYAGGYGQPEPTPVTQPLPGVGGSTPPPPGAPGQWPQPDAGR
jgi:hypothetical protein